MRIITLNFVKTPLLKNDTTVETMFLNFSPKIQIVLWISRIRFLRFHYFFMIFRIRQGYPNSINKNNITWQRTKPGLDGRDRIGSVPSSIPEVRRSLILGVCMRRLFCFYISYCQSYFTSFYSWSTAWISDSVEANKDQMGSNFSSSILEKLTGHFFDLSFDFLKIDFDWFDRGS